MRRVPDQARTCIPNSTGQASGRPRTGSDWTRLNQTGSDQTKPGRIRPSQTGPNQTSSGQAIGSVFDETSRSASANFSARPDSRLIRDASRAVVDAVDADAGTRLLAGRLLTKSVNQSQALRRLDDRARLLPGGLLTKSVSQSQATRLRLDDCARLLASRLRTESIAAHAVAHL